MTQGSDVIMQSQAASDERVLNQLSNKERNFPCPLISVDCSNESSNFQVLQLNYLICTVYAIKPFSH